MSIRFALTRHKLIGIRAISRQLLERDPNKRLGYRSNGNGLAQLREQPWFAGLDWDVIGNKAAVPPFEPDVRSQIPDIAVL
jgi:hypothetical protein